MATPADLSNEDTQSLELATLKATLDNDFIEAPATPWKVICILLYSCSAYFLILEGSTQTTSVLDPHQERWG
jgi:hypothetical protein